MNKYYIDIKKIVKFYYGFLILIFINLFLVMSMFFFGLYLFIIPLIIACIIFIIFTVMLVKMSLGARKYVKNMDDYYVFKLDKKYSYGEILSLIENNCFIEDVYRYIDSEVLFLFVRKFVYRILVLDMDVFDKKRYDSMKIKINRACNKKNNFRQCSSGKTLVSKKLRVNIIYLNQESDNVYKYLSNNIRINLNRSEGILNIVIVKNKMIIPSINDSDVWSDYSVIKYKVIVNCLCKVLNVEEHMSNFK